MMNYFSEWLLNGFREGYALSRNPFYHDVVNRIELSPETIGVVEFCSKNYRPILPRLHEITDRFNCHFHYTITAYGKDIEPNVPSIDESIETQKELSAQIGNDRLTTKCGGSRTTVCGGSHPTIRQLPHNNVSVGAKRGLNKELASQVSPSNNLRNLHYSILCSLLSI